MSVMIRGVPVTGRASARAVTRASRRARCVGEGARSRARDALRRDAAGRVVRARYRDRTGARGDGDGSAGERALDDSARIDTERSERARRGRTLVRRELRDARHDSERRCEGTRRFAESEALRVDHVARAVRRFGRDTVRDEAVRHDYVPDAIAQAALNARFNLWRNLSRKVLCRATAWTWLLGP